MKKNFTHFFLVTIFLLTQTNKSNAQVNVQDSLNLVDIYNKTGGTYWSNKTNWLNGPVSTWFGVTVTTNRVTGLNLPHNLLRNTIPVSVGNLDELTYLDLSFSNFSDGPIPANICNLSKLTHLDLSWDHLIDTIPSCIGNFTDLTFLGLFQNKLTGKIPASFGNLVKLPRLELTNNRLTGSIPPSLGNLTNLTYLSLATNNLTDSIPSSLGNLVLLTYLYVYNNHLTGPIPISFGNLTKLQYLRFDFNRLTGPLPSVIGNLTRLRYLDLNGNSLTGAIPSTIGNCRLLQRLVLTGNKFSGPIPVTIGNLTSATEISLNRNNLSGAIPATMGNLTAPCSVNLSYNKLTGSYPSSIIGKQIGFSITHNKLSGALPSFKGSGFVNTKDFSYNEFGGRVTADLLSQADLYPGSLLYLDLSHNKLTGVDANAFDGLATLTTLRLNNNEIEGALPSFADQTTSLDSLTLSNNKLTYLGLEPVVKKIPATVYAPQAVIPLQRNGAKIFASGDGTASRNTYYWYKVDYPVLITSKTDSTYRPSAPGGYYVKVKNAYLPKIILLSDTIQWAGSSSAQPVMAGLSGTEKMITAYPNPAKSNTLVLFTANGKYSMLITDMYGKTVELKNGKSYKGQNNVNINTSNYAPGIYQITVTDEDGNRRTCKLIKQ